MMIGLVATSLLASCKKNNNDNTANGQGFRATTEQGAGNNTRTHIDGLNPTAGGTSQVLWDDADLIKVRNNAGTVLTYQLTDGEDSPNGIFYTGEPHDNFFQPNYTAIYPAFNADDVANTITGEGTAQFTLPATQSYVENSFAKGAMPMMAVSDNQTLPFKNVLGGLCFPIVGNLTVKKIVLTSANTADRLNGVFDANYNNGEPTLTHNTDDGDNGDNTITLMCNPAVQLDATNPTDFIVMVPPGMLESGFAITAYGETDNVIYTKSTSTAPGADFIQRKLIRKTNANLEVVEYTVSLSANPTAGGTVTGGGTYHVGDNCTVTATANSGYAFTNWTEGGTVVSTAASYSFDVAADRTLVANFTKTAPPGAVDGLFTVQLNPLRKVYFTKGNLQWSASGTHGVATGGTAAGTWRIAPHQWDMIGNGNTNISSTYTGWIDLFGWGTSGWNSGAVAYQPYSTNGLAAHYFAGGSSSNDMLGNYRYADWGVYNDIKLGDEIIPHGTYHTLRRAESICLFGQRPNAANLRGLGTVNNVHGLILLPDDWSCPAGLSFIPASNNWNSNVYNASQWEQMEQAGAVFLPAAWGRFQNYIPDENAVDWGYYWNGSLNEGGNFGDCIYFNGSTICGVSGYSRNWGRAIRLVRYADQ